MRPHAVRLTKMVDLLIACTHGVQCPSCSCSASEAFVDVCVACLQGRAFRCALTKHPVSRCCRTRRRREPGRCRWQPSGNIIIVFKLSSERTQ